MSIWRRTNTAHAAPISAASAASLGPSCTEGWDLQAVATHEFGHAFGLGHVKEGLHANLTMAPYILPCQSSEARLGLGDVRGLRALY